MIRSLIKLGLFLVVGILVYNLFFGTEAEKAQSKEIFQEGKELVSAAWGLLKTEKEKFDEGKYDNALDKIGGLFNSLKDKAEAAKDSDLLNKIAELEQKREQITRQLKSSEMQEYDDNSPQHEEAEEDIKRDIGNLLKETESLMNQMEEKEN